MPDQANVSGRDTFLLVEALAFTVEALSALPIELRPDNNIADMKRLVEKFVKRDAGLAQSKLTATVGLVMSSLMEKRTGPNSSAQRDA